MLVLLYVLVALVLVGELCVVVLVWCVMGGLGLVVTAAGAVVELLALVLAFGAVDSPVGFTCECGERGVGYLCGAVLTPYELELAELEFACWYESPFALCEWVYALVSLSHGCPLPRHVIVLLLLLLLLCDFGGL